MNGILLLLVQAIEVVGCIAIIIWAVREIKMAHKELLEIQKDVKEVREDLKTECTVREAADKKLKKTIEMVIKHLNNLQGRVKRLENKV